MTSHLKASGKMWTSDVKGGIWITIGGMGEKSIGIHLFP